MRHRLWGLARRYAIDAVAVGLFAVGAAESRIGEWEGPLPLVLALTALMTLPVMLRFRYPVGAPLAVFTSGAVLTVVVGAPAQDAVVPFFAFMLASWIAGAYPDRRGALIGWTGIPVTLAVVVSQFDTSFWSDFPWALGLMTAAWAAGFAVNFRSTQVREAETRANRLAREREERAREAVAEERARIARELHDVVAHSVSVMTVQAAAVRRVLKPDQAKEREALEVVEQTGRQALNEMRRLLGILRQSEADGGPELAPQPGIDSLDRLVRQVRRSGMPVELRVEGDRYDVAPMVDLAVYRVVQEALTNALRHAGPAAAEVVLRYADDGLELEVANDGNGDQNGDGAGRGLEGMRERIAYCGGTLDAGPRDGGGFAVRARIPVPKDGPPA